MKDAECVAFLRWALPRLNLRWPGYRRVRGQVCKRIQRRMVELGLADVAAYRQWLDTDAAEWQVLDSLCVVTISRFYRDRGLWEALGNEFLPAAAEQAIAARQHPLRCWSIGCASGEEPYTLSILWALALARRYPALGLRILATDIDERVLARARRGDYAPGSVRDLPRRWRDRAFEQQENSLRLRQRFRAAVELRLQDVRRALPEEVFHLILCRNLVLTYFDETAQRDTLTRLVTRLSAGGAFVVGAHEQVLPGIALEPVHPRLGIYRRPPGKP